MRLINTKDLKGIGFIILVLAINFSMVSCSRRDSSRLRLEDCYIEELGETVRCGTFAVMENRQDSNSRIFRLNFIILPARTANPAPDPIFVFDGGPGAGAANRVELWARNLEKFRQEREIVLVDQRGTGSSNPLPCHRIGRPESAQTYLQDMFPEDYVQNCRKELENKHDLRYYHTTLAADDIDELRAALGYDKINTYSASYGGQMNIVYMNRYPQNIRSIVIETPAVPALLYPADLAPDTQEVLERLFTDCAADPDCAADYPDLRDEFYEVLYRLQQGPVTVDIINPINGEPETVTFTYNTFLQGFRAFIYKVNAQRWAPAFIYWSYRGIYAPLVEWAVDHLYWVNKSLMDGMFLCVTCTESIPYIDYREARLRAEGTFMGMYRLNQQKKACELWVQGTLPAGFHQLPTINIPTLILTGDLDPAIRPRVGRVLAESLPNSLHYNAPNTGHGLANVWWDCLENAEVQFVSQGSFDGLDFSCSDGNQRPPFVSWRDYSNQNMKNLSTRISRKMIASSPPLH